MAVETKAGISYVTLAEVSVPALVTILILVVSAVIPVIVTETGLLVETVTFGVDPDAELTLME